MKRSLFGIICCFAFSVCGKGEAGCYDYAVNPPLLYSDCCDCNWTGHLDYLYWKPCEDDLFCGNCTIRKGRENQSTPPYELQSKRKRIEFDWDSGFRVGLGYSIPCDCWEISIDWTHFRTDVAKKFQLVPLDHDMEYTFCIPCLVKQTDMASEFGQSPFECHQQKSHWSVQFNQVDLQFSRAFLVGPCVVFKPHIGITSLYIQQRMTSCLESSQFEILIVDNNRAKCEFKGVGLSAGFDSIFSLACGLGFYGEWNASCYYGTFDQFHFFEEIQDTDEASGLAPTSTKTDFQAKLNCLRVVNDLAIGISWLTRWNCDRNIFLFKAGWEHHTYFGQNMYPILERGYGSDINILPLITNVTTSSQNLYLYGFVFSIGLGF